MMNDNMTMQAFRRMFPNWDKMTEEEKRSAMTDPDFQGRAEARRRFAEAERLRIRTKADKEETATLNRGRRIMGGAAAIGL